MTTCFAIAEVELEYEGLSEEILGSLHATTCTVKNTGMLVLVFTTDGYKGITDFSLL